MAQKCSLTMIAKPDWTAVTCKTAYATYSDDGGHNCHDDTRVQLATFVYGVSNNGYQYWCNGADDSTDISVDIWGWELDQDGSPDCNESTNRGYNFPSMYQYSATNTNSAQQYTTQYNVVLSAGATYTLSTCGTSSTDTYLRLKSGTTQVAYNDDACGLQSTITYTPTMTGVYTLYSGCYGSGSCSGKINVKLVSSSTSPNYYSATNTNSAQQYTVNYTVSLTAGKTYVISTCGNSSSDTYLRLFGGEAQVAYNDDACGLQSKITYTPTTTGSFSVHAGCYGSGTCNGIVTVNLQ
jgi:hypothetical protein